MGKIELNLVTKTAKVNEEGEQYDDWTREPMDTIVCSQTENVFKGGTYNHLMHDF